MNLLVIRRSLVRSVLLPLDALLEYERICGPILLRIQRPLRTKVMKTVVTMTSRLIKRHAKLLNVKLLIEKPLGHNMAMFVLSLILGMTLRRIRQPRCYGHIGRSARGVNESRRMSFWGDQKVDLIRRNPRKVRTMKVVKKTS
jgi:hypothetical protein